MGGRVCGSCGLEKFEVGEVEFPSGAAPAPLLPVAAISRQEATTKPVKARPKFRIFIRGLLTDHTATRSISFLTRWAVTRIPQPPASGQGKNLAKKSHVPRAEGPCRRIAIAIAYHCSA